VVVCSGFLIDMDVVFMIWFDFDSRWVNSQCVNVLFDCRDCMYFHLVIYDCIRSVQCKYQSS